MKNAKTHLHPFAEGDEPIRLYDPARDFSKSYQAGLISMMARKDTVMSVPLTLAYIDPDGLGYYKVDCDHEAVAIAVNNMKLSVKYSMIEALMCAAHRWLELHKEQGYNFSQLETFFRRNNMDAYVIAQRPNGIGIPEDYVLKYVFNPHPPKGPIYAVHLFIGSKEEAMSEIYRCSDSYEDNYHKLVLTGSYYPKDTDPSEAVPFPAAGDICIPDFEWGPQRLYEIRKGLIQLARTEHTPQSYFMSVGKNIQNNTGKIPEIVRIDKIEFTTFFFFFIDGKPVSPFGLALTMPLEELSLKPIEKIVDFRGVSPYQ